MKLCTLPLDAAVGHIVCHNIADSQGRKAYPKGHVVREADLEGMATLGLGELRVAVLDADDVHENEAARRLTAAIAGPGVSASAPHSGRVNLRADQAGPLVVDVTALSAINDLDGLTVATLPSHRLVRPGQNLATIKVIPFAVPEARLACAEALGSLARGVLSVRPLLVRRVGVVLVSSPAAMARIERGLYPAIEARVRDLGATVVAKLHIDIDEAQLAAAISNLQSQAIELLIIAGETSIVDIDDVIPAGVRLAGGRIEHYGAPVEPGNLLLLGYLDAPGGAELAVLGAPGCVRSRDANIVDLLLPRLMAGEHVRRNDIVALGHGGLLG